MGDIIQYENRQTERPYFVSHGYTLRAQFEEQRGKVHVQKILQLLLGAGQSYAHFDLADEGKLLGLWCLVGSHDEGRGAGGTLSGIARVKEHRVNASTIGKSTRRSPSAGWEDKQASEYGHEVFGEAGTGGGGCHMACRNIHSEDDRDGAHRRRMTQHAPAYKTASRLRRALAFDDLRFTPVAFRLPAPAITLPT